MIKAFAYLRTSSATNVGSDKDSDVRQREAVTQYAKAHGIEIAGEFYDAAVSGADDVQDRPGFASMLERIAGNGVKMILCESPDRFARDLMVQLSGHEMLKDMGVMIVPVSAPDFFTNDTPTAVMVRQILGAVAQFDRAMTLAKLASGRNRKRREGKRLNKAGVGKCGGPLSFAELAAKDEGLSAAMATAKAMKATGASLRSIAKALAAAGHVSSTGKVYTPQSVANMI